MTFTEEDKRRWLEINAKYYGSPEEAWAAKVAMHTNPQRAPSVYVMPSYQSPITGKWIDTPSQRRDDLARNNSRPWEGMDQEVKVAQTRVKEAEKAEDRAIESAVVQAWQSMPLEKRKVLETSV